jgi:hypothetical protein
MLPTSLGLLPELWLKIFKKSRRLAKFEARVAAMDELLSESLERWTPVYYAAEDPSSAPIIAQVQIDFACRFKILELTKCRDEEETHAAIFVFNHSTREYEYTEEDTDDMFYQDWDDSEEDVEEDQ